MTAATQTVFLTNAFSINMLSNPDGCSVNFNAIDPQDVASMSFTSAVGHADTAAVIGNILGVSVPMNRATVTLNRGDKVVIAQLHGTRLPEGATQLPDGASIKFWLVSVN